MIIKVFTLAMIDEDDAGNGFCAFINVHNFNAVFYRRKSEEPIILNPGNGRLADDDFPLLLSE